MYAAQVWLGGGGAGGAGGAGGCGPGDGGLGAMQFTPAACMRGVHVLRPQFSQKKKSMRQHKVSSERMDSCWKSSVGAR